VAPRSADTTARTPSRTVDPANRYVSQPPYRTESTPGASSMPRPAQSRSGYAGAGGYQRPSASPAPAAPNGPSRTYSPPSGGEWRSVSPATRPGGAVGSAPSRMPSARPSPGGAGGPGGSGGRPSMGGPSPSSGAMPRSSGGSAGPSGGARGGAPSGGGAQSRGGRG
jgi:hypothetical protein